MWIIDIWKNSLYSILKKNIDVFMKNFLNNSDFFHHSWVMKIERQHSFSDINDKIIIQIQIGQYHIWKNSDKWPYSILPSKKKIKKYIYQTEIKLIKSKAWNIHMKPHFFTTIIDLERSTMDRSNFPPRALLRATLSLRTTHPPTYIYI